MYESLVIVIVIVSGGCRVVPRRAKHLAGVDSSRRRAIDSHDNVHKPRIQHIAVVALPLSMQ